MRVHNADGSTPEMCGNGLRCAALHFVRNGIVTGPHFEVDTDAGPHACEVHAGDEGESARVEITMRAPSFVPGEVPVMAEAPLLDAPFEVLDTTLHLTALSIGNPHAVTFDDVGEARLVLGSAIAGDRRFPDGVNVGFARPDEGGGLDLHVFERGVGWTRACGTGACAAAVAAVVTGRAPAGVPIEVRLPGGTLSIVVPAGGGPVRMTGPARHVFDGELDLGRLLSGGRP